ncbi:MAG TPA: cytochrome c [Tepidisphaeraceae bacterium]|jgi:mono/diheme cytochrome c family protein|nr:cytochrome c [Tepidisphaeraceae bacterium]
MLRRLNGLLIAGRPEAAVLGLGAGMLALCAAAHDAPAQPSRCSSTTPAVRFDAQPAVGDRVYTAHCAQCHGAAGKGDGKMAHDLGADVPDLTDGRLAHESDARLFRWISRGKRPMPAFEKDLSEPERWGVVAYLRTLEGKGGGGK